MRNSFMAIAGPWKRAVSSAAAFALAVAAVATASPARAAVSGISCTGWQLNTYTPGLTNTLQPTTVLVDGDLNVIDGESPTGSCVATGSRATAGQEDQTLPPLGRSCTQLFITSPPLTFDWNDRQSSTISGTGIVLHVESNVVILDTGTVTSGEFSGDAATLTLTAPNIAFANCGTPGGVTTLDFAETVTITP